MKKRILSLLTMLCMITALLPTNITVFAAERSGDLYYQVETNGTITITDCYEYTKATKIEIPSEIDGKKVTNIGNGAFSGIKTLEKITIPYGVTSIGEHGFE